MNILMRLARLISSEINNKKTFSSKNSESNLEYLIYEKKTSVKTIKSYFTRINNII